MFFERLVVNFVEGYVRKPGVRPFPKDLVLTHLDGRPFKGRLIFVSPSQVTSFDSCQRLWGWDKLDRVEKVQSKSQILGEKWHGEVEGWLRNGAPPETMRIISSGVLAYFPMPRAPGLQIEEVFVFRYGPTEEQAVLFWGFKDAQLGTTVYDLKSTSGLDWAKSEQELMHDPQAVIYAFDAMLEHESDVSNLSWNYVTTKGKVQARKVPAMHTWENIIREMDLIWEIGWQITQIRLNEKITTAKQLPYNDGACGDYGGCPHRNIRCDDLSAKRGLVAIHSQARLEAHRKGLLKEKDPMAPNPIIAKMKSDIARRGQKTDKVDAAVAAAPDVPVNGSRVTVSPPAETKAPPPVNGSSSTVNKLRGFIGAAKAAAAGEKPPAETAASAAPGNQTAVARGRGRPLGAKNKSKETPVEEKQQGGGMTEEATPGPTSEYVDGPFPKKCFVKPFGEFEVLIMERADGYFDADHELTGKRTSSTQDGALATVAAAIKAVLEQRALDAQKAAEEAAQAAEQRDQMGAQGSNGSKRDLPRGSGKTCPGFMLLLDGVSMKGPQLPLIDDLIAPSRDTVEGELGMAYRLVSGWPSGAAQLSAQIDVDLDANPPTGMFSVMTKTMDKEVLDILIRKADHVFKGVF